MMLFQNAESKNVLFKIIYYGMSPAFKVCWSEISNEESFLCVKWKVLPDVISGGGKQAIYRTVSMVPFCIRKGEK